MEIGMMIFNYSLIFWKYKYYKSVKLIRIIWSYNFRIMNYGSWNVV